MLVGVSTNTFFVVILLLFTGCNSIRIKFTDHKRLVVQFIYRKEIYVLHWELSFIRRLHSSRRHECQNNCKTVSVEVVDSTRISDTWKHGAVSLFEVALCKIMELRLKNYTQGTVSNRPLTLSTLLHNHLSVENMSNMLVLKLPILLYWICFNIFDSK